MGRVSLFFFCPATGHIVENRRALPESKSITFCPHHGVKLFDKCSGCGTPWGTVDGPSYFTDPHIAASFCADCGEPAPWLSRADLVQWLKHQVQSSSDLPSATRLELREVLEQLQEKDADDARAASAWKRVRELAPKAWAATEKVRDRLISEAIRRMIGG
jgi:hypothetical protein